jgi:hypothetical protein
MSRKLPGEILILPCCDPEVYCQDQNRYTMASFRNCGLLNITNRKDTNPSAADHLLFMHFKAQG